jgi:hypothetical protein
MDLLLLTQGWRRYVWTESNLKQIGQVVVFDEITGIQTVNSKQINNSIQFIQISDAQENLHFIETDSTGHFSITVDQMNALRGGYLYLKPLLSEKFDPHLNIYDPFPTINKNRPKKGTFYPLIRLNETRIEDTDRPLIISMDGSIALNEVTITEKAHKPFRDKYMGHLDSLAQLILGGPWVCECPEPTPFLNDYREGYTHHPIGGVEPYTGKKLTPVKGKQYTLIKYEDIGLENGRWNLTDIQHITYYAPEYSDEVLLAMNHLWRVKGYYGVREFYQPDDMEILSSLPDARNTLLWAPSVITDEQGEATINFYCSDINTGFIGRIEGVDGAGLLGAAEFDFRVIKTQP